MDGMIDKKEFLLKIEGNKAETDHHVNTNISKSTLPFCSSHAAQNVWCKDSKCQHFVFLLVLRYISATFPLQHTLRHCLVRLFVCLFWHRLFAVFLPLVTSTQTHSLTSCCVRSCAHITSWWAFGTVRAVLSPFDPQNDVSNCISCLFVVIFLLVSAVRPHCNLTVPHRWSVLLFLHPVPLFLIPSLLSCSIVDLIDP